MKLNGYLIVEQMLNETRSSQALKKLIANRPYNNGKEIVGLTSHKGQGFEELKRAALKSVKSRTKQASKLGVNTSSKAAIRLGGLGRSQSNRLIPGTIADNGKKWREELHKYPTALHNDPMNQKIRAQYRIQQAKNLSTLNT